MQAHRHHPSSKAKCAFKNVSRNQSVNQNLLLLRLIYSFYPFQMCDSQNESKLELPQFALFSILEIDSQLIHEILKLQLIKIKIELKEQKLTQIIFEQKKIEKEDENNKQKDILKEGTKLKMKKLNSMIILS